MKKTLLLFCLLLTGIGGACASVTSEVTIFDQGVSTFYDYFGTRAANKLSWTSGANSGVAGFGISLTGSNVTLDKASNWALVVHSSTSETTYTMTLTAPAGCKIKGYELKAQIWSGTYPNSFTLTAEDETNVTINSTTLKTLTVSGLNTTSTDIDIVAASATSTTQRWLAMKSLVVTLEFDHTITYIVKDESDNTLFTSGAIGVPLGTYSTLPAAYRRDYFYTYTAESVTIDGESSANTDWEFIATPKSTAIKYTEDTTAPEYYNLNIRSKYLVYNDEATGKVKLQNSSEPFSDDASWAFIGNPYDGFKLINKANGTNKFLTYTSVVTGNNSGNNNIQFVDEGDFTNQYWYVESNTGGICLRMKANTNIYFHHDNTYQFLRTCSSGEYGSVHNDAGSTIVASTDEEVLFALYNTLAGYSYGTTIGQYYSTDPKVTNDEIISTLTSVNAVIQSSITAAYPDAYAALVTISENIAFVIPTDGCYRLKNASTGKYLRVISDASGGVVADVEAANAASTPSTIVKIETSAGHQFYNCQSREFRQCYYNKPITATYGTHDKYALYSSKGIANQLAIAFAYGNGIDSWSAYVEGAYYAPDGDDNIVGGTSAAAASQWIIEEAESVTINLNGPVDGYYYATLCLPFDVTITSGADAYTLAASGQWLVPTAVEDNEVPAGTPVLLKGTSGSTATATINTGSAFNGGSPLDCDLTGTYLAKTIDGETDYVLGINGDKVGFYHWDSNNLAANRAYIDTPEGPVKGFVINWDDADGIQTIGTASEAKEKANIYNLAGQRMSHLQKGVNIVNGKKVLVK
ncbi:MAG: hypothetical protein E7105_11040 [Prevotella sp.]|nr:hypothetical protein [Prevotella sp.]